MRNIFRITALAAVLLGAMPAAQAAVQTYSFNGAIDSGHYLGETFSGQFSFDDAGLSLSGTEYVNLASLSLNFLSTNWTLANAVPLSNSDVTFENGNFLGLSFSAESANVSFSVIPGFSAVSESFIAYDTPLGNSGAGSVIYAAVPEPESYALLLAGLGLMGVLARRRARATAV